MTTRDIEGEFRSKVSDAIRLDPEGIDRFYVQSPFHFPDGDGIVVVLRKDGGRWLLTDEGHTFMHLSYWIDEKALAKGNRAEIVASVLRSHGVQDRGTALVLPIPDGRYGDALFTFIQAILRLSDVLYLSREVVRSTFLEDLQEFVTTRVPQGRLQVDWHHPLHDPTGKYRVDYRINGMARPVLLFGITTDAKASLATITLLMFEKWREQVQGVAVYECQEELKAPTVARLTDVAGKQFSAWSDENKDRLGLFLGEALAAPR